MVNLIWGTYSTDLLELPFIVIFFQFFHQPHQRRSKFVFAPFFFLSEDSCQIQHSADSELTKHLLQPSSETKKRNTSSSRTHQMWNRANARWDFTSRVPSVRAAPVAFPIFQIRDLYPKSTNLRYCTWWWWWKSEVHLIKFMRDDENAHQFLFPLRVLNTTTTGSQSLLMLLLPSCYLPPKDHVPLGSKV